VFVSLFFIIYSYKSGMDFSSSNTEPLSFAGYPDVKVAPIVIAGAAFVGRAVAGGVIGGAATWGVNRVLDNRFPSKK
jgi:hypothetical protein